MQSGAAIRGRAGSVILLQAPVAPFLLGGAPYDPLSVLEASNSSASISDQR